MRSILARGIMILALLLPLYFAGAALGARFGLFDWRLSLGTLIVEWGPRLLIGVLVLAIVILVAALVKAPRSGWRAALIAILIPALGLGYLAWVRDKSADIPPIHDVSTRPADPPVFSPAMLAKRAERPDTNPVVSLTVPVSTLEKYQGERFADMGDRTLGEIAAEAYPAVRPLTTPAARRRLRRRPGRSAGAGLGHHHRGRDSPDSGRHGHDLLVRFQGRCRGAGASRGGGIGHRRAVDLARGSQRPGCQCRADRVLSVRGRGSVVMPAASRGNL